MEAPRLFKSFHASFVDGSLTGIALLLFVKRISVDVAKQRTL